MAINGIDEKDMKILDVLRENAKLSSYKIAKKILLPVTTVHSRIKRLEREGIIKQYTILLDDKKLGKNIIAYTLIHYNISLWEKTGKNARDEFKKALLRLPYVEEITYITGSFDVMLKLKLESMDQLNSVLLERLRKIPGIGQTETIFVLEKVK